MLHTYTASSRPNVPPRTPTTTFPPPPRPPPPSTSKTKWAPPPSSFSRYGATPRSGTGNGWTSGAEDSKAETRQNAYKAWEQMRHVPGPILRGRPAPPKSPKTSTYSPGREPGNGAPEGATPKRTGWDRFADSTPDSPGMSRSKSTRIPKTPGFAPGPSGVEEPQARQSSAYFNVSRGERPPPPPRDGHHFPPPPLRHFPKKHDPVKPFEGPARPESPFTQSRVSTPYATTGGEKTYFSSQGLGRSSSWRESKRESEWYDSESTNKNNVHPRPKSARPDRNRSASPQISRDTRNPPISSSSSSTSSSDEGTEMWDEGDAFVSATQSKAMPPAQARNPMRTHRRTPPSVRVEDIADEDEDGDKIKSRRSGNSYSFGSDARKRNDVDQNSHSFRSGSPEELAQHQMKREAEKNKHPAPQNPALKPYTPSNQNNTQPPLQRPRSWHPSNGSVEEGVNDSNSHAHHDSGGRNGTAPMYENNPSPSTPSMNISSNKWSDQWPFNTPKQPRHSTAALPPYWAIPSCLAPSRQPDPVKNLHKYCSLNFF